MLETVIFMKQHFLGRILKNRSKFLMKENKRLFEISLIRHPEFISGSKLLQIATC
ncbi:hypothetical protein GCM10008086_24360 [Salegentibacter mishustinae]|nr:hypothetical protein GCM10008086_24360 [Salegentibacter mishustinae]